MTAKEDFISELDGSFFVTVEGRAVEPRDVQKMLASFGELASFSASGSDPCDQVCILFEGMHASQIDVPFLYRPFTWTFATAGTPRTPTGR